MSSVPKEQDRQERRVFGRVGVSPHQPMHRVDRACVVADDLAEALSGKGHAKAQAKKQKAEDRCAGIGDIHLPELQTDRDERNSGYKFQIEIYSR